MQSSKLGLQVWALASYLLTTGIKGQASMKFHRDLGVTQKTAWHLAHRIRETWAKAGGPPPLDRYVTEFEGRQNRRDADTVDQMAAIAQGMVGKRLRYQDLAQ